jgi:4-aminobutyrate aminotransferase/(S)-3-amino-2-methylpropionate transaminase
MAIEMVKNGDSREPHSELCTLITKNCVDHRLILLSAGTFDSSIRILSPMVIIDERLNRGLAARG